MQHNVPKILYRSEGEVDFEQELEGEIFEPLKDISYFKNFTVDHKLYTVVWLNDADFAPEFLSLLTFHLYPFTIEP